MHRDMYSVLYQCACIVSQLLLAALLLSLRSLLTHCCCLCPAPLLQSSAAPKCSACLCSMSAVAHTQINSDLTNDMGVASKQETEQNAEREWQAAWPQAWLRLALRRWMKIGPVARPQVGRPTGRVARKESSDAGRSAPLHRPAGYKCTLCCTRRVQQLNGGSLLSPGPAGPCKSPSA